MLWQNIISLLLGTCLHPAGVLAQSANEANSTSQYEYIVVGSGAGGGPLACRLAMAGHSTLLIEAGNDQNGNINISVRVASAGSTKFFWA